MAYKQIDEENFLDRDTYRRIKKMDRATLERLIHDIYARGRKKGLMGRHFEFYITGMMLRRITGEKFIQDLMKLSWRHFLHVFAVVAILSKNIRLARMNC